MGPVSPQQTTPTESRVRLAVDTLRARGERVTQARRAVLEVLDRAQVDEHLGADEIAHRAATSAPGLHRATVYRALATLGGLGLVAHTHVGGSATVYHLAAGAGEEDTAGRLAGGSAGHSHLQCTGCGTVIDIPDHVLRPLARCLARDLAFELNAEHAALLGTCSACATSRD